MVLVGRRCEMRGYESTSEVLEARTDAEEGFNGR